MVGFPRRKADTQCVFFRMVIFSGRREMSLVDISLYSCCAMLFAKNKVSLGSLARTSAILENFAPAESRLVRASDRRLSVKRK